MQNTEQKTVFWCMKNCKSYDPKDEKVKSENSSR